MQVIGWIWNNILTSAAFFLMLLVLIGQLIGKKGILNSVVSAIKCYIGYNVFSIATGGLGTTFRPILYSLKDVFGISITINDSYYGLSIIKERYAEMGGIEGVTGMVIAVMFATMLLLAVFKKVTKIRALPIQGHVLVNFAVAITAFVLIVEPTIPTTQLIILAGILTGVQMAVCSNFSIEPAQDLTDGVGMCLGHTQMIGDRIAWEIGKRIEKKSLKKTGKKPTSFDNLQLPEWLGIFNDVYVAAFIVMFVFFGIIMMVLGKDHFVASGSIAEGASFGLYIFTTSAMFPIYLVVLFTGMRMFVAEIMEAFEGISQKVFKGVLPGLDCAAFYGFCTNPNVITVSFLSGTIMMIICTIIGVVFKLPFVVMVGFTQMMFDNSTVGLFGHHRGGIKGLLLSTGVCALVDTFLCGIAAYVLGYTAYSGVALQFDLALIFGVASPILKMGMVSIIVIIVVLLLLPQLQYYLCKNKEDYWKVASDYEVYKKGQEEKGM